MKKAGQSESKRVKISRRLSLWPVSVLGQWVGQGSPKGKLVLSSLLLHQSGCSVVSARVRGQEQMLWASWPESSQLDFVSHP